MNDLMEKALYTLNKLLVFIAGSYIVFFPPFTWIGTLSSAVMMVAAMVSIYAIWTSKPEIEFIALWFVICGVGSYAGFVWIGGDSLVRSAIAAMLLVMLLARGHMLWRQAKQFYRLERLLKRNVI